MQHYIIGSRLLKTLFPDNPRIQQRCKDTADYDILIDHEPTQQDKDCFKMMYGNKTECHYIPPVWNYLENIKESLVVRYVADNVLKDVLFTLKSSHVSFDKVHKKKTFYDIWLMSEEGCTVIEPLFYELHEFWTNKFGEKWRADFTKESSDFFNDAVSRENVHDDLHELVKKYDKPAFKYLQDEGQTTVYVCPEKFKNLTFDMQKQVIIEEAQVLAIEREFLNPNGIKNQYIAYAKWLEAMVDRIAPLWQIPFICNNFHNLLSHKNKFYDHKQNFYTK
jgi:thiol-disulfide isomerase/thioredoxin